VCYITPVSLRRLGVIRTGVSAPSNIFENIHPVLTRQRHVEPDAFKAFNSRLGGIVAGMSKGRNEIIHDQIVLLDFAGREIFIHSEQMPTGRSAVFLAPSMTSALREPTCTLALHDNSSEHLLHQETLRQSIPRAEISFPYGTTLWP
jgi:hypothetical protein